MILGFVTQCMECRNVVEKATFDKSPIFCCGRTGDEVEPNMFCGKGVPLHGEVRNMDVPKYDSSFGLTEVDAGRILRYMLLQNS